MDAGLLRHRIDIEDPVTEQDVDTGEIITTGWTKTFENVPAAIEPVSVNTYIAAHAAQADIVARIVIRWRPGLNVQQRIVHGDMVYSPEGFLPDKDSGRDYVTIPCSAGAP